MSKLIAERVYHCDQQHARDRWKQPGCEVAVSEQMKDRCRRVIEKRTVVSRVIVVCAVFEQLVS